MSDFDSATAILSNDLIRETDIEFQKMFKRRENGFGSTPSVSTDYQFKDAYREIFTQCQEYLNAMRMRTKND